MKDFKNAHEMVDEIERLTEVEKTQVLEVRLAELQRQQAELEEVRKRKELERTQRHVHALLSILHQTSRARALRDAATLIDTTPAPAGKN